MNIIDELLKDPANHSRSDFWFAWRPVRIGALGTGPFRWLKKLWRNQCCGVTIYQDPADFDYPLTVE